MTVKMAEVMEVINRYTPKGFAPKAGLILGSGLSSLAEQITNPVSIPYQAIPGLQAGAVYGHASLLVMGQLNNIPVVCLRGRLHLYEGVSYESIRTLVQIVKRLGAGVLMITCAAGSMRPEVGPGELMMIQDHINFHPGNPLVGPNDETIGPRFVSMDDAYDPMLQDLMVSASNRINIPLHKGVYISTLGPSFETPAEIRAFKSWGADAVGMSVVPEVIIARHSGIRVACVAAITNLAAGMSKEKISHEGTLHFGEIGARKLIKLVPEFLKEVSNVLG
ncbi:Purine nucleoside phosphorylase 2 [Aquicella siphonis]|uniref:Purine nucleoside phosphorylase n=1 Tax=Aquicella siphonis TaxID=254247 RepID=A0A5E4PKT2_9COXI|nr:purine-nucleoside phosphorylase [Aquicella siphonis]VVC76816.1 Purine nucleoside phosphorylase 2 [Aquicella siphonis]